MSQRRYANKPDGYRYVRECRRHVKLRGGSLFHLSSTWALYEVRDGRARRAATLTARRACATLTTTRRRQRRHRRKRRANDE